MVKHFQRALTNLGVFTGHPIAFLIVIGYALFWWVYEPKTLDVHGWATLATWMMTLFIQRATHRDTQAIQAKLDELLLSHREASSELTHLDDKAASEIEEYREQARSDPR